MNTLFFNGALSFSVLGHYDEKRTQTDSFFYTK